MVEGLIEVRKADYDKLVSENAVLREENTSLRVNLTKLSADNAALRRSQSDVAKSLAQIPNSQIAVAPTLEAAMDGTAKEFAEQILNIHSHVNESRVLDVVRDGLMQGRVDLFLQPIVMLPQRTPSYFECYSCIRAADGSVVTPAQYIPLAKANGLLASIDNMLLIRCIQLVRRARNNNNGLGFFCNISIQTLADRKFFRKFIIFMEANKDLASRLTFEFSEEDIAANWDGVFEQLTLLSGLGFGFSMDHVTQWGFAPSQMASRNFKFVKVDIGTILSRSDDGGENLRLLCQELDRKGMKLIVEKIETQDQLDRLLELGNYLAQGFLLGEPRLSRSI